MGNNESEVWTMRIPDFTLPEINKIKFLANFTAQEIELFDLRNEEHSLEDCAEIMNVSVSTIKRINSKMKSKIIRVI